MHVNTKRGIMKWVDIHSQLPKIGELCLCYKRGSKDNRDIIGLCRFGYAWKNFSDKWLSYNVIHLFKDSNGKLYRWTDFNEDTGETVVHEGIDIYRFYNIALDQADYEDSACGINVYDECDYWISLDDLINSIKKF